MACPAVAHSMVVPKGYKTWVARVTKSKHDMEHGPFITKVGFAYVIACEGGEVTCPLSDRVQSRQQKADPPLHHPSRSGGG
jgi:hypothetical protein